MSRIAPDFWAALMATRSSDVELRVRAPLAEVSARLLGSISEGGMRRFVIALLPGEMPVEDFRSRGLVVFTVELIDERGLRGPYVTVECRDVAGHDLFDLVGGDLAAALANHPPAAAIKRVLGKWRRFWGQPPRALLSREEQIGLFAELWFLSRWLIPAAGAGKSMLRWRGPWRSRHDFEWAGRSVEVKGTTLVRAVRYHISGLDQLEAPENGELLFFALQLREEAGAAATLPGLIAECRTLAEPDGDALGLYETGLIQAGYSPAQDAEYEQTRWRIARERLYRVDDTFPRLQPEMFPSGLPAGVAELDYTVDPSAIEPAFANPDDARTTLQ